MKGDVEFFKLTDRELDVLKLVAQGFTAGEIATSLGNKERTVRNQMESVRLKLRAHNSAHAVAIAKDRGLI